jgi:hypothetical protein
VPKAIRFGDVDEDNQEDRTASCVLLKNTDTHAVMEGKTDRSDDAAPAPLLRRLQDELPKRGFIPLTPIDPQGPSAVFAYEGMSARFGQALKNAKVYASVYRNKLRISPSVYSDDADIESFLKIIYA